VTPRGWITRKVSENRQLSDTAKLTIFPDEDISLYQRITRILEKLTNDVEADLEKRFQSLNRAFDAASQSVDSIVPQAKHIQTEMEKASRILQNDLSHTIKVRKSPVRRSKIITKKGFSRHCSEWSRRSASTA
jgi:ribosome-binding factor A